MRYSWAAHFGKARLLLLTALLGQLLVPGVTWTQNGMWVSAYYAGWMQGSGPDKLPATMIDFGGVTQIIHFSIIPNLDGTIDDQSNSMGAGPASEIVQAGHAAGKKVLVSVGGWDTETKYVSATSTDHRATFIANLLSLVGARSYDGIDIDWEPIADADTAQFAAFITDLRSAMTNQNPALVLTAAVGWEPALFARIARKFDQINLMTYDMSGPWQGWVTWYNAPVYDGGYTFPSTGGPLPSADGMVNQYIAAGVPAAKLGIGIDFYGYIWSGGSGTPTGGVTAPRQAWTIAPAMIDNSYAYIMDTYFASAVAHWDSVAKAAYLSIDNAESGQDYFISYDNEQSCAAKVSYVKNKPIGGLIIWELGGGWRTSTPVHDPLLQAVKQAAFTGTNVSGPLTSIPSAFALQQNYPNPFNPTTRIRYTVGRVVVPSGAILSGAEGPASTNVRLAVDDVLGREVAVLIDGRQAPGNYEVSFDGRNLSSGVYFYKLTAGSFVAAKSMILIR